jgi:anti-sigma factor RsiW
MNPLPPPTDDELHALVDGRLAPADAQRLQARVDADPVMAETVMAWRAQRESLSAHLAASLNEALDPSLTAQAARLARGRRALHDWQHWGGVAAGVVLAFALGWIGHAQWQDQRLARAGGAPVQAFAHQALAAHVVYVPEVRHAVEVDAAQQEHLVQWLSKRLDRPLRLPQLGSDGFQLMGGRLLPGDKSARAQFMFQDAQGLRITLYVGAVPSASGGGETAFRFTQEGKAAGFYWVDDGFGYALSGNLPRDRLLALAETVYRQLGR